MDAIEDRDSKLQRASADLVRELSAKLPSLLWRASNGTSPGTPRKWAPVSKTEKLVSLLEPFQEWPQLLDPHLQKLVPPLVEAFLAYLIKHRSQYGIAKGFEGVALYPLPRAICRLLYTFCKVRGVRVICNFLNNEPKYFDPMLRVFIAWDSVRPEAVSEDILGVEGQGLQWEERYVMLIWLSHLLLAPFDLASLSSDDIPVVYQNLQQLGQISPQTPLVAKSLLSLALHYINVPGKEREAATALLARLALRGDIQKLGLLTGLKNWAFATLQPVNTADSPSVYSCIGVLSFIARLGGSGQIEDLAPLLEDIFAQTLKISQGGSDVSMTIRSSALARKTVVKILRNITVMALALTERGDSKMNDDQVSSILEDAIDHFLVALADKDTPVRFAASKALSVITLKLNPDMGAEVIEAVIGSLGENILYERDNGTLTTPFEAKKAGIHTFKRNLSAVDAQRWQGLMLTLSHLLFRRAPPTHQLPEILQSLVSGLSFEQRSSTGTSLGSGVRDAACFGVWSLSRKYVTSELQALPLQTIPSLSGLIGINVLQKLAVELVTSACIDSSGNIRRGASAALQELIGRHPNSIREGISLVQVVDYHAVARRSHAMIDVAKAAASLDPMYWSPLVESLMEWRGIGSPDAESRRSAAKSIGVLSIEDGFNTLEVVLQRLLAKLPRIPRSDVESRHGCLLSMSSVVDGYIQLWEASSETRNTLDKPEISSQIARLWEIFESSFGPTDRDLTLQSSRPELMAEASSCLISILCRSIRYAGLAKPPDVSVGRALEIVLLCVSRSDDISIETASEALSMLFPLLSPERQDGTIKSLISHLRISSRLPSGRGQILALGAILKQLEGESNLRQNILAELLRYTDKEELIEKRVAAVKCFATCVIPHATNSDTTFESIIGFLNDYTTDRRGDIGSLIRVEAIQALRLHSIHVWDEPVLQQAISCLFRLASEKLDKVRLQAWLCLEECILEPAGFPPRPRKYEHLSDVSSQEYFFQLLGFWSYEWLRLPLLQGMATSAVAGAEGLIRASRAALIQHVKNHRPHQHRSILIETLQLLSTILSDSLQDDRYAIPVIELIAFLIDSFTVLKPEESEPVYRKIFALVQKAHFRSSNIARIEAAVKVYAALTRLNPLRQDALKKLTGILLHPFPRIRTGVADYLFMVTEGEMVKYEDWSLQPKELKGKVEGLRAILQQSK